MSNTSSPIKTALLSYGMSGEIFHAPLISASPGFELRSIVQRNKATALQRYPKVKIASSVEEVLQDDAIELVVINTPNETHYAFASQAIKNGKHVVVEKPFTVTADEGALLIDLAKAHKVILSVFQNRRWDGDFLTVAQVVRSGELGKIVEFEAHYDRFRNYIEPNTWKEEKNPGTGIVYNLGSHMIDQVLLLFGMPEYVDARIGIQRTGGSVDDFYDIRMEYSSHLAIIKSSYLVLERMPRYIVHGDQGSFVKFGIDPQEQALKEKGDPRATSWGREDSRDWGSLVTVSSGKRVVETVPGNYLLYYENVHKAIRDQKTLSVTGEDGLNTIRIIEACYESNRKKQAVKLSPR